MEELLLLSLSKENLMFLLEQNKKNTLLTNAI